MSALRKVLVIDDDPVVAKSFDRVLSSDKGYVVITASNGAEALDKLRSESFDMVYTDIKMPGMDGLEVAERVKAKQPWTPVVIITGYGTVANEVRASAAGVSSFLHKPLSPEMIEGSAARALTEAAPSETEVQAAQDAVAEAPAEKRGSKAKNILLFMAAPVIGLLYAVLFPFVGLGMLVWYGAQEIDRIEVLQPVLRPLKTGAAFAAAPFVGLAFILLLPFIGIGTFIWVAAGGRVEPNTASDTQTD